MTGPERGKLKPLARARRGPLLQRRGSVTISRELEEELFRVAEVLSEGGCRGDPLAREAYFGSTMISVDLGRLQERLRAELDEARWRVLASAVEGSVRVRIRAMRLAYAEAARRVPGRVLGTAQVEVRVRLTSDQLHIDVDLEAPLRVSSGSRRR
jgi:hypothetical protein